MLYKVRCSTGHTTQASISPFHCPVDSIDMSVSNNCPINFQALGERLHQASRGSASFSRGRGRNARSSVLLLLDLHGVLIERFKKGSAEDRSIRREFRAPWMSFKKYNIWQRPHLEQFLDIATRRYAVGIWSAAEERNILPVLTALSDDLNLTPCLMQRLAYLCNRSQCRPDPASGKYAVVKYLPDVWASVPYTDANTIIVDDTFAKVRFYPKSAIVIPEYTPTNYPSTFNTDDTLLWLLLYIEHLVVAAGDDLSTGPGIAQVRSSCMSFESFCNHGRLQALRFMRPGQEEMGNSSALVFFPQPARLFREPSRDAFRAYSRDRDYARNGSSRRNDDYGNR